MKKSTRSKKAAKKISAKKAVPKRVSKKAAKKTASKKKAVIKRAGPLSQGLWQRIVPPKKKHTFVAKQKSKVYKDALISDAEFLHDHVLNVTFSDGHQQKVDFSEFLNSESTPPYMKKYKLESRFKRFKVEAGNLVWGKDWDLIFPIEQLYVGKIN